MSATALIALAVMLAWPVPRLLARMTAFRRAPRPALVVWQATTVAAVLAALFAAPAAVALAPGPGTGVTRTLGLAAAVLVTGVVTARLLLSGHRVGRRLRAVRRTHRDLVDLLGLPPRAGEADVATGSLARPGGTVRPGGVHSGHLRVLDHSTPTAYCVPGLRQRVVVTRGALDLLPADEVRAVIAHERAHLAARHDLVAEFFTVVHEAVPGFVRSAEALGEVNLLIEVLADRSAVNATSAVTTGRAIVRMAGGPKPSGTMAVREGPSAARVRLDLLDAHRVAKVPTGIVAIGMYAFAAGLLAVPVGLLTLALA